MRLPKLFSANRSRPFWLLLGFLALLMLCANGARGDLIGLVLVRPVAILLTAYGMTRLTWPQVALWRGPLGFVAALLLLVCLHLVPLPPDLWQRLPGRSLIADIDRLAGLGPVWRPLSMAPAATRNALFALFVPVAVVLLMIQLEAAERRALLAPMLIFGLLGMALGLMQMAAPSASALWFYKVTNNGLPVGLFANRNHAATFLAMMFPMLAVFCRVPAGNRSLARLRGPAALAAGALDIVLILESGSRAGLFLGLIALASIPLLMPRRPSGDPAPGKAKRPWAALWQHHGRKAGIAGTVLVIAAIGAASFTGGGSGTGNGALARVLQSSDKEERAQIWRATAPLVGKYFPLGSGAGSFVEVFKIDEPIDQIEPTYANHAHNDLLEVAMTTGIAGIAAMLGAAAWVLRQSWRAWRTMPGGDPGRHHARLASVLLGLIALASVFDYPLRVPTLAALAVIWAFWLRNEATGAQD